MATLIEQNQALIALLILVATFVAFVLERFPPSVVATAGKGVSAMTQQIETKNRLFISLDQLAFEIVAEWAREQ